jgi:hypothetical protein
MTDHFRSLERPGFDPMTDPVLAAPVWRTALEKPRSAGITSHGKEVGQIG